MSHVDSTLSQLRRLINQVEDSFTRRKLEEWVCENVVEFGMNIDVSTVELDMLKGDKGNFMDYRKRQLAHEIGLKMIDECASIETRDTPYSERTTYKIFGIKHRVQK